MPIKPKKTSHGTDQQFLEKLRHDWLRLWQRIAANELLLAIAVVLVMVVVAVGFGWENNKLIPVSRDPLAHYNLEPHNHLSFMAEWDGPDYLTIVQHGYVAVVQANFFPLYPLLVWIVHLVISSPLDSALLVSWAALVGAVYFYLKIIKHLYKLKDNLEALRGALFFLLYPTGIFLLAVYTESLFACLSLGALYFALQKRYLPASLLALLATATHETGLFVVALVALVLFEQKERLLKVATSLVIGSLGLIAYMIYLQVHFHNALAFVTSQRTHGWLQHYGRSALVGEIADRRAIFLVLVIAATIYWWQRRRSFAIYSLFFLGIVALGGLGAFGRYTLAAFPVQLMLYDYFRDKKLGYSVALTLSAIFWAYFLFQYAGGYTGG